jgi:hypothetical protein
MPLSTLWSPYLYNSYTTLIQPFTPCPCLISDHHTCTTAIPPQSTPLPPCLCLISDHHTCTTAIPPQSNPLLPCPCLISGQHTCTTAMPPQSNHLPPCPCLISDQECKGHMTYCSHLASIVCKILDFNLLLWNHLANWNRARYECSLNSFLQNLCCFFKRGCFHII